MYTYNVNTLQFYVREDAIYSFDKNQNNGKVKTNPEYKSDVFSMIMEYPENALQVYNALSGNNYDNPEDVQIIKLENGISLSIRNDASFIIDRTFNLYEHQSTANPNMPLRSLIYFVNMIEPKVKGKNLYGRRLIQLPTPRFVVFYNGKEPRPEVEELYLSDSFEHKENTPDLELHCTVYNINKGCNEELKAKCPVLYEYMVFTDGVQDRLAKGIDLRHALEITIDECIENNILKDFFEARKDEVMKVTTLDYTFERRLEFALEEGIEEGRELGREIGIKEGREVGIKEGREAGIKEGREVGIREGRELGIKEEREKGLFSLIDVLKGFITEPEDIFNQIRKQPNYADVTLEDIKAIVENE